MNDKLVKRNRTYVVLALAALVIALIVANEFYPLGGLLSEPAPEDTPETAMESTGWVDVIYFASEPRGTNAPNLTPMVGIGLHFYPPGPFDCDQEYHIKLTPKGYNYIPEPYEWTPEMDESIGDKKNRWTWAKLHHHKDNAMFAPGEFSRAYDAMASLSIWYSRKALCEVIFSAMQAAVSLEPDEPWRVIEIDLVALMLPVKGVGVENGEPVQEMVYFPEQLQATIGIYRARRKVIWDEYEGREVTIRRTVDDIVAEGELTWDELEEMMETQQVQIEPGQTMYGMRQYRRGRNCEWAGREIEMIRESMAGQ